MKKDKIVIYTNENCPYCKQIKEKLDENKIKYTDKLTVDHEKEWQEITNLTGLPTVPTIYYKDNYFVPGRDFQNQEHLISLFENFKKSTFPIEQQNLEKIKSLNYSIGLAFQKTDQLLRQIEQNYKELFEDEETKTE